MQAVKRISDLQYDTPLPNIPAFDIHRKEGDPVKSIALSGSEMQTMTESQWKQVLTVSSASCVLNILWIVIMVISSSMKSFLQELALSRNCKLSASSRPVVPLWPSLVMGVFNFC